MRHASSAQEAWLAFRPRSPANHNSLTAKTKSACRLDFIPRAELLDLLRRNPQEGFDVVRMLSEEIFQMRNVQSAVCGQ
jgi:hypothetical protein